MLKYLFLLLKRSKRKKQGLTPQEIIRKEYKIRRETYADGKYKFIVDHFMLPPRDFETLQEARDFIEKSVNAKLSSYVVEREVVE